MKVYVLEREQELPRPLVEVFAFFSDPGNLERLTPAWLRLQILTPRPIKMAVGTLIRYRLRLRGIPIRWTSEITHYEPPQRFVDEQRQGPYRLWMHEHDFEDLGASTLVRDRVHYAVWGGPLVARFLVRPDLERIFEFRRKALEKIFT